MIAVENGKSYEMKNPNADMQEVERMAEDLKQNVIRAASPFIEGIKIFNKTKNCNVVISFSNKRVVISVTNPQDEIFSFDEAGDIAHAAKTQG